MSILSKFVHSLGLQILTTNCYETIHTWEPDCLKAILVACPGGIWFSLKTYITFYSITSLIAKKGDLRKIDWKKYICDVLRSTAFLSTNLILFLWFLCKLRHMLGFFTVPTMGWLSSTLASFFALLIEKKSRRPALALYLTNLASETIFRQFVNHGYIKTIKYGECFPFTIGLAMFMYLHSKGELHPNLQKVLNFTHIIRPGKEVFSLNKLPYLFHTVLQKVRSDYKKSLFCDHNHSCLSLAAESFTLNFTIGIAINVVLTLLKNLKKLSFNPLQVIQLFLSMNSLRIPVFFGLMPSLFHVTRCLLNRMPMMNSTVRDVSAGVASGLAMLAFPNVSIAMYTLWKAIEGIYLNLAEKGKLPFVPHGDLILYTLATGYVLWQPIIEPQAIRKGYLNFLLGITGNRIKMFNRDLYEHFGFQSKLLYHPQLVLNPKYITVNPMLYQKLSP